MIFLWYESLLNKFTSLMKNSKHGTVSRLSKYIYFANALRGRTNDWLFSNNDIGVYRILLFTNIYWSTMYMSSLQYNSVNVKIICIQLHSFLIYYL
jgi:hypothetical protein